MPVPSYTSKFHSAIGIAEKRRYNLSCLWPLPTVLCQSWRRISRRTVAKPGVRFIRYYIKRWRKHAFFVGRPMRAWKLNDPRSSLDHFPNVPMGGGNKIQRLMMVVRCAVRYVDTGLLLITSSIDPASMWTRTIPKLDHVLKRVSI